MKAASKKKIKKKANIKQSKKTSQEASASFLKSSELENELRKAEEKYKFLFENILNGYAYHKIVVNRNNKPVDYIFLEVNDAFQKYTGMKRKDIIGKKVSEVIPGIRDAEPDLISLYGKVAFTGKEAKFDLYFEPFDKWYYVNAYSPQKGYFIAIFEEITERKKVEEDLRWELSVNNAIAKLSEALIDPKVTLQDAANITLSYAKSLTGSNHGYVSSIDPETKDHVGHTLTEMMKKHCKVDKGQDVRFPVDKDGTYGGLWGHSLNTNEAFFTNSPAKHKASRGLPKGHIDLKNFLSVPAMVGDNLVGQIALANSSRDYTDRDMQAVKRLSSSYAIAVMRKRADELIRESEEKYRMLFDNMLNGFIFCKIVVDRKNRPVDYIYIEANEAFEKFTGLKRKDVIGKRVTEVIPGIKEAKPDLIALFGKLALKGGEEKFRLYFEPFGKWYSVNAYSPARGYFAVVFEDITEQKKNEEFLIKSKAEFESIFNSISDAVVFTDMERRIMMTNPAFGHIFGYEFDDLSGKTTSIIYADPDDFNEQGRKRFNVRAKITRPVYEMNYRRKDGSVFVGETLGTQVKDDKGKVLGFLGVIRDITNRKLTEKSLSWESSINKTFAELGRALMAEESVKEVSVRILDDAKRLTGSKYGYVGYIDPKTGNLVTATMTGDIWDECKVKNKDIIFEKFCGLWGWVLDNKKPLMTNDVKGDKRSSGTPRGHIPIKRFLSIPSIVEDELVGQIALANKEEDYSERDIETVQRLANLYAITIQRARKRDAIIESETQFRTLFEHASDALFLIDMDGNFVDVNNRACEILGYSRKELLNLSVPDIDPVYPKDKLEEFMQNLEENKPVTIEAVHKRKDGTTFPVEIRTGLISIHGKNHLLSLSRDISERKRMEDTLLKVRNLESLGTLAGGIAHDFNNIMMAIFGNIQLAKMKITPGDAIYFNLAESEKSILAAKSLARQLLTFSKGGSPIRKIVSISRTLENSLAIIPRGSSVYSDINIDKDLWTVNIDEEQMSQVFENIIKNSVEALPNGGAIDIKAKNTVIKKAGELNLDAGKYVLVSIKDKGSGISDENLDRIFDPYFTTKGMGTHKGLGLGLSIAHSIINSHDGLITVRSKEAVGSTFYIYIPVGEKEGKKKVKKPLGKKATKKEKISQTEKVRILLMDDDDSIRNIASDILREVGYQVETSSDGNEAFGKYKDAMKSKRPFDMVILDLTVKYGLGGKETLDKLVKIDPHVKAIISSGFSDDPVMVEFGKYGFKGVLVKPYRVSELEETLNSVMS
jgi:PAS domain S-box-containing protein